MVYLKLWISFLNLKNYSTQPLKETYYAFSPYNGCPLKITVN